MNYPSSKSTHHPGFPPLNHLIGRRVPQTLSLAALVYRKTTEYTDTMARNEHAFKR